MKPPKKNTEGTSKGFTAEERAAMKEYIREKKREVDKTNGESALLESIAKMSEPDRTMAKRLHAIVKDSAPSLAPRTWYGMPAYANEDGNVVCFFQNSQKFRTRYSTLGFTDKAHLDEGNMWPNGYAVEKLTASEEARIAALVKKAVG